MTSPMTPSTAPASRAAWASVAHRPGPRSLAVSSRQPVAPRAAGGDEAVEGGVAAERGVDDVVVARVVAVRRRRGEDGRQVDGVGAERGDVIEVRGDGVEGAEGADEDLVDDVGHGVLLPRGARAGAPVLFALPIAAHRRNMRGGL